LATNSGLDTSGMIIKIERFAIHDGPGIRTIIFMKGCPLRCQWCSSPESQLLDEETFCKPEKELVGRRISVREIMDAVLRDYQYYTASSGGITLSGGEPLYQPAFACEILKACKSEHIQTAIETSGFAPWEDWEKMLPILDLIYFDLKHSDPNVHRKLTGVDNHLILENLRKIVDLDVPVTIRIPLIPACNDFPHVLDGIASIMRSLNLRAVQLLPYHKMGSNKYLWLGRRYAFSELKMHTDSQLAESLEFFTQRGFSAQIGG
jgi:glycyl-radical enzyme activating protein